MLLAQSYAQIIGLPKKTAYDEHPSLFCLKDSAGVKEDL
jgi:hypothetical protein